MSVEAIQASIDGATRQLELVNGLAGMKPQITAEAETFLGNKVLRLTGHDTFHVIDGRQSIATIPGQAVLEAGSFRDVAMQHPAIAVLNAETLQVSANVQAFTNAANNITAEPAPQVAANLDFTLPGANA